MAGEIIDVDPGAIVGVSIDGAIVSVSIDGASFDGVSKASVDDDGIGDAGTCTVEA